MWVVPRKYAFVPLGMKAFFFLPQHTLYYRAKGDHAMKNMLEKIRQEALDAVNSAELPEQIEALRVRYLGKKR